MDAIGVFRTRRRCCMTCDEARSDRRLTCRCDPAVAAGNMSVGAIRAEAVYRSVVAGVRRRRRVSVSTQRWEVSSRPAMRITKNAPGAEWSTSYACGYGVAGRLLVRQQQPVAETPAETATLSLPFCVPACTGPTIRNRAVRALVPSHACKRTKMPQHAMAAAAMLAQSRAMRSHALKLVLDQATTAIKAACTTGADGVRTALAVLDGNDTTSYPAIPALLADMEADLRALAAKYDAQVLAAISRLDEDVRAADNLQNGLRLDAGPAIPTLPAPASDDDPLVAVAVDENDLKRAEDAGAPAPRPNATRSRAKAAKMQLPRAQLAPTPESPASDRGPSRRRDPVVVRAPRDVPPPPPPPPVAVPGQPGKRRFDQVAAGADRPGTADSSDAKKRQRTSAPDPPPPPTPSGTDATRAGRRLLARREKKRLKKLRKQEKKRAEAAAAAALDTPDPADRDESDAPDPADRDDPNYDDGPVDMEPPPSQERRISRRLSMLRAREGDENRANAPPPPPPPPPPSTMRRRSMTRTLNPADLDSPRPRRLSRSARPDTTANATTTTSSSTSPAALLPFDPLTPTLRAQLANDPYGRGMLGTPFILTRARRDAVPLQVLRTALGLPTMGAGPAWNNHLMLQAGVTKQNERYCVSCGHAPYSTGHVCCDAWEVGAFRKGTVVFGLRRAEVGTTG
ncbi:hypothetical protein AMAG_17392 [Allomyces macrogynus ATCC 38327]|uniref:Uncharacterized protein n=1 Tax=Allomyces macrogynus (strain ATCC 38327) TaxID=578462 RepID=A0A0L0TEB1_ALLM3|nr:hypothetical protein AMAG_17392 [Allomyces macrogynus ATCC 38327]|eukprot:KNE73203.1 hypothetical protein AMAG_17392 [Allomyces macrogynus ATCC 38327]